MVAFARRRSMEERGVRHEGCQGRPAVSAPRCEPCVLLGNWLGMEGLSEW